jgi:L-ascorbate metabolism protein UlaG (beta-lactamase superfamily)
MQVEWFGQAAFALEGAGAKVFIDPFGDVSGLAKRGIAFQYPAIQADDVDLVLITHEHADHNGLEAIAGEPAVLRSTAGRLESPIGEVVAIASEHDPAAGTQRGPNTIFAFDLDGVRVAHMGDFGQSRMRDEQRAELEGVELLFIPVGAGPTIDAEGAEAIVEALGPRWVVPMHFRTPRIGFLETEEAFVARMPNVHRLSGTRFDLDEVPDADGPLVVVPDAP